jgi:7-cyano-7-deazaguanine synthase
MKKAVVLISGGMDSALCTALALESGSEIAALHLNYGQRTEARELKAFYDIIEYYGIAERLVVDVSHFSKIGGSSLTDVRMNISGADLGRHEIPTSYVPFRNGNILAIAASWAEVINASLIYIGAIGVDNSGYPDCSEDFFKSFEGAINKGTKPGTDIQIITPIINMSKKDVVVKGVELKVPFHLTWSCYKNSDIACGECDSCALRLRGFQQAGLQDPLRYVKRGIYI